MKLATLGRALLLGLALAGPAGAQPTPHPEALRAQLQQPNLPDSTRVRLYEELSRELRMNDLPAALQAARDGLALARRAQLRISVLYLLNQLGYLSMEAGDMPGAAGYFQQVLREAHPPRRSAEELEYTGALQGLAITNVELKQFARAMPYYREVLGRYRQFAPTSPAEEPAALSNMAQSYLEWHRQQPADSLLQQAQRLGRRSLRLSTQRRESAEATTALAVLGQVFQLRHQADSAVHYQRRSVELLRPLQQPVRLVSALGALAEAYTEQGGHWPEVVRIGEEMRALSQQLGMPNGLATAHGMLAEAYRQQGNWRAAHDALRAERTYLDTLNNQERHQTAARFSAEFDTERKESRIRALEQEQRLQRTRFWSLLGGLGLLALGLAVAGWLTVRLRRSRTALAVRNEQLAQARATQDRLYSVIGHDLRTPLTALEGLATLIDYYYQPQHQDAAAMQEVTQEVRQTTSQLTGLLDNLLHWAASQSGELAYRPEALDAAALLRESADLYAPAARARQVTVQVARLPAGLPPLWADRNMVLTQLRNLLGNTLKVAPVGSAITLSAQATEAGVELSITDAGPGLSPAQLAVLEQSGGHDSLATRLPGQRGTGLGLPLVRQLARRQQGSLVLDSAPGRGTTARLGLPLAVA